MSDRRPGRLGAILRRALALVQDRSPGGAVRRLAALAFGARVLNAGLGFATQILLARWMGDRDYGIYAYVWVWVLVGGGVASLGLPVAALKFVPAYTAAGDWPRLRGFLLWSRTLCLIPAAAGSALAAVLLMTALPEGDVAYLAAGLVAFVILPIYVLTDIQTGIARAYDYADLGLAADYLLRPVLLIGGAGLLWAFGAAGTAPALMAVTLAGMLATALLQGVVLERRLRRAVPAGPAVADLGGWAATAWPLLTVTGFTLLLGTVDILALKLFVPAEEIALYVAATKIVAVASFVSYGVSNTSAHRFAAAYATGDVAASRALARETVAWTFWPTLAVAAALSLLAAPLLSLFGAHYASGAAIVVILAGGLVAGATVGPADRALAMADHGRVTAAIYAAAFAANLVLALVLIPAAGLVGAALSTSLALAMKAAMLSIAVRNRLGLTMFVASPARAGTTHDTAAPHRVTAELVPADESAAFRADWQDLCERALEPNVFYTPGMVLAGAATLPGEAGQRLLLAWRGAGAERRLVGLWPLVRARGRHMNPLPVWRAAEHYGTLSTPLLDPDRPDETLDAMLSTLAATGAHGLLLPYLGQEGPVAEALRRALARHDRPSVELERHARAILRSEIPAADYIRATLETRRRKEADRQRRRLADEGALAFRVVDDPAALGAAIDAFLDLEAAGWKGKAGTALRLAPGGAAFIHATADGLAERRAFRVALLELDGRPIAAGLVTISGRRAYYIKTTYDETFARFSPGLLLTLDLTQHLLDDPAIDEADSIAVADHPMIDRVWTARLTVASLVVATSPGGGPVFRMAVAAERLRERARLAWRNRRAKASAARASAAQAAAKAPPSPTEPA